MRRLHWAGALLMCTAVATAACTGKADSAARVDSGEAPIVQAPAVQSAAGPPYSDSLFAAEVGCDRPALCLRDTAYVRQLDVEPGQTLDAQWLFFGRAGDSLDLRSAWGVNEGSTFMSVMVGRTDAFQERNSMGNTASYARFRMPRDGAIRIIVSVDEFLGDSVPYNFKVQRFTADESSALRATGDYATLTLSGAEWISVIPVSLVDSIKDRAAWFAYEGRYKVALVGDSLYQICQAQCARPDTVKLTPGSKVTRKY